jgi:hypothetical protein
MLEQIATGCAEKITASRRSIENPFHSGFYAALGQQWMKKL